MSMLTGEFRNTLDEKGRILFPAKLRSELAGNVLIVTQALDRCLWLFTPEEWKTVSSKLMEAASPFSEKNRVLLGVSKYIELWDAESYRHYIEESEASFRGAAEELGSIFF